eukprot:348299-Pyramimonas_sp.AAC.1
MTQGRARWSPRACARMSRASSRRMLPLRRRDGRRVKHGSHPRRVALKSDRLEPQRLLSWRSRCG